MKKSLVLVTIIFITIFMFLSCEDSATESSVDRPAVTTTSVTNITLTSAQSGGNVTSDGGVAVTARGVCWSTTANPTIADDITNDGSGSGNFISNITGLSEGTSYYVRAYATNSEGTSYGDTISFQTTTIQFPEVSTADVSVITTTTAQCGGNVTSEGDAAVTTRGVCWSTSDNPTISDDTTNNGSGTGIFTSNITGLTGGTTYYVRAYATSSAGTGYGTSVSFTTPATVTDIDGNVYQTVIIGTQVWMAENLKVTQYRGGAIPKVNNYSEWQNLSTGAYCDYDTNSTNSETYGRLYNWYAVNDSRNIAPEGWHVPTDDEWKQLEMYLGMTESMAIAEGWRGFDEGGKLKEADTTHWSSPNNGATNESGFTALPGGYRNYNGNFYNINNYGYYWTSSARDGTSIWGRMLGYLSQQVVRNFYMLRFGYSVRCVKD